MQVWMQIHPSATPDHLGLIGTFIRTGDKRRAVEQLTERYGFGWYSMKEGFTVARDSGCLMYEGDPDLLPLWGTVTDNHETVIVYESAIVAVMVELDDGTVELLDVARLD